MRLNASTTLNIRENSMPESSASDPHPRHSHRSPAEIAADTKRGLSTRPSDDQAPERSKHTRDKALKDAATDETEQSEGGR
jgi:hypothetical protein